ncbi:hypothetical protein [Pedobacter sp. GR22-6]|uniref:hypothetical protein n=1 Tax=Pedobacter sp. GR22-6 TaxID=3127957 RepID=UPI00307FC21E
MIKLVFLGLFLFFGILQKGICQINTMFTFDVSDPIFIDSNVFLSDFKSKSGLGGVYLKLKNVVTSDRYSYDHDVEDLGKSEYIYEFYVSKSGKIIPQLYSEGGSYDKKITYFIKRYFNKYTWKVSDLSNSSRLLRSGRFTLKICILPHENAVNTVQFLKMVITT